MASLAQKTTDGVVWSTLQRFVVMGVTFISNVVLARILSPEDFGCIAMLMIFIGLSNTFIDGGFGSALIQKKEPTQIDYSTIFYWNLILSFFLYGVLFFGAPLIAGFYKIDLLTSVLRVQGTVLILNAFSIVQQNQLRKKLEFKKLAIVNILSSIVSLLIAIGTAMSGWGVWSLVAQQISLSALNAILVFIATRWKPQLVFSSKSFHELFNFGGFILLSNLFSTLSNEIQGLLVGRMFTPATLGLYNQAYRLEGSAANTVSDITNQVTYPVLSSLQNDRQKLKSALKRFIQVPAFVCCPIMAFFIVAAKPIIILIYSEKWVACVPYLQILCLAGLAVCLQGSANQAITAIGKSKVFFRWTIIKRTLTIVLSVVGIMLAGMNGLLWCLVIGTWSVYFINGYLVEKHIGYSLIRQMMDILPFILLSVILGALAALLGSFLSMNMYVVAVLQLILIITLYLVFSLIFKFECLSFMINLIKGRIKKQ